MINLLRKRTKFVWNTDCQKVFDIRKTILMNEPVLLASTFAKEFQPVLLTLVILVRAVVCCKKIVMDYM